MVRAFVNVEHGYTPIDVAMSDEAMRTKVIGQAWEDLQAWRKKYKDLQEFARVFDAINETRAGRAGEAWHGRAGRGSARQVWYNVNCDK